MASQFPNSTNQIETTTSTTNVKELPSSYQQAAILPSNIMMNMSYPSSARNSHQQSINILHNESQEDSFSGHDFSSWRNVRDEMFIMHQMNGHTSIVHQEHNLLQGQEGLSLSLGTHSTRDFENSRYKFHDANQDEAKVDMSSTYLKVAQELLDEVVSVTKLVEQTKVGRMKDNNEGGEGSKDENCDKSSELSPGERQDLQAKHMKLVTLLDEIDRRYRQYYNQLQILVSSFDSVAGRGAAKPYTTLALKAISRHFRCLRDVINGQIHSTQKSLGERNGSESSSKGNGNIPRLRYVEQQLQQQKALQQFGVLQPQMWRPQRGLPESSVTILRAWLFEHFLHPYPKDSDKIMLARQTGLSKSQVSNWFINARVRLWKPMIEEMYKEEFNSRELQSSPTNATHETNSEAEASDYTRTEDLQQCSGSKSKPHTDLADFETAHQTSSDDLQNRVINFSSQKRSMTDVSTHFPSPRLQLGLQQDECYEASELFSQPNSAVATNNIQFGSSNLLHDFVG